MIQSFAPTVANVHITGDAETGATIMGNYNYNDKNGDLEGASTFRWYRTSGTNNPLVEIIGADAKQYQLTEADENQYLVFEVVPVALTGNKNVGNPAKSSLFTGAFTPVANEVKISGKIVKGNKLKIDFVYADVNGDLQGGHIYKWHTADTADGELTELDGATSNELTITESVFNKYICASVIPVSMKAPAAGTIVYTAKIQGPFPPVVKNVKIAGTAKPGYTLSGSYDFFDDNLDEEGSSILEWIDTSTNAVLGNGTTLKLTSVHEGKKVALRVTGKSIFEPYESETITSESVTVSGVDNKGRRGGYSYSGSSSGSAVTIPAPTPTPVLETQQPSEAPDNS